MTSEEITVCFIQGLDLVKKGSIFWHSSSFDNSVCKLYDVGVQDTKKINVANIGKILVFNLFFILNFEILFSKDTIYSGFSLQGNYSFNEINFPLYSKFFEENDVNINSKLFEQLSDKPNLTYQMSKNNDAYVVSFGMLTEDISIMEINKKLKIETVLIPQVFIIDNKTKNFIKSNYAWIVMKFMGNSNNEKNNIYSIYKSKLFGGEKLLTYKGRCSNERNLPNLNIYDLYELLYDCIQTDEVYKFNLQIRNVDLGESDYKKYINFSKNSETADAIKYKIANIANAAISSLTYKDQILMLPYSQEQSIFNIQNQFSDVRNLNMNIPEPDFVIDLKIKGTLKKLVKEDEDEGIFMYGLGINFKILEPLSETIIFDDDFKYFLKVELPKDLASGNFNSSLDNDIYIYNRVYSDLIDKIATHLLKKKIDQSDKNELKKIANNSDSYKSIVKNHKKIAEKFF